MELASLPVARVTSDDCSVAYRQFGEGPPLLLLMGVGAAGSAWQAHAEVYCERFSCIIPDNRGAGQSDVPVGPYSSAQMADDCARVIEAAGARQVAVVGISMGGVIAQQLALRHSAMVGAMVLVSSWARCDAYLAEVFDHLRRAHAALGPGDFAQLLQLRIWSPPYVALHLEQLRQARQEPAATAMSTEAFSAQCAACTTHDALAALGAVDVPTLVTAGEADTFTVPERMVELHGAIAGARLEFFPGGHAHHWEDLDRFNDVTLSWLEKVSA
jgi:pimeloyl-ACP methyl ester carboxylesterase